MTADRPADYLASLVRELCALPHETEWGDFKVYDAGPHDISESIASIPRLPLAGGA